MLCVIMPSRQGRRSYQLGAGVKGCIAGVGSGRPLLALEVRPWCKHAATHEVRAASHTHAEQSLAAQIQQASLRYRILVCGTSAKCMSPPGHVKTCPG